MTISEKLIALRKEYNLTQEDVAKVAGVSDKAVSTWELGRKEPRIRSLQKICDFYNIDISGFISPDSNFDELIYEKKPAVNYDELTGRDKEFWIMLQQLPEDKRLELLNYGKYLRDSK